MSIISSNIFPTRLSNSKNSPQMKWTGSKKFSKEKDKEEEEEDEEEETGGEGNKEEEKEATSLRSRKSTEVENLSSIESQFEMDENAIEDPIEDEGRNLA